MGMLRLFFARRKEFFLQWAEHLKARTERDPDRIKIRRQIETFGGESITQTETNEAMAALNYALRVSG